MNISNDLKLMLKETGWSKTLLARHAGVSRESLQRILTQKESESVVDKLIPFVYGDKRPPSLPKKPRKKKPSE